MKTKLHYYGHSCFGFDDGTFSIIIDPYKDNSVPNLTLDNNLKANLVLCSHSHDDHDAVDKVNIINTSNNIDVIKIHSFHDKRHGLERGDNIIHVIKKNGLKIVHLGDLGDINSIEDINLIKNSDVLLIPINGFYTIGPKEAVELINLINPKLVIPMHYYKKEFNSGYKDGNQIEIFKSLVGNYEEIKENEIFIEDYLKKAKFLLM